MLAERGIDVIGADPAEASLEIARRTPFADRVRWVLGDATGLPPMQVDLATKTANVAQVFLTDDDRHATLHGARDALRPAGQLVFETRVLLPGLSAFEAWSEVTDVSGQLLSFRWSFHFDSDGVMLTSDSTLEVSKPGRGGAFAGAWICVDDVRNAPTAAATHGRAVNWSLWRAGLSRSTCFGIRILGLRTDQRADHRTDLNSQRNGQYGGDHIAEQRLSIWLPAGVGQLTDRDQPKRTRHQ